MPATRQDLFARLAELGIETATVEHEAVFTVAESSRLERELPGGHTKNLFLKDKKGRLFLVVALGHAQIDLKTLHKTLGCDRLSFGKPELLMEVLGVTPGSVTPFALINDRARRGDGDPRCRYDAPRAAQLSSAGEHGDDQHRARRPLALHPRVRSRAAHRWRCRRSRTSDVRRSQARARDGLAARRGLGERHGFRTRQAGAAAAPAGDIIKDATTATFAKDVIEASRDGAGARRLLGALVRPVQAADARSSRRSCARYGGKVRLVKINIDENPAIAGQLRVQSIPTVYAFRDGRPLDGFMGAQPESAVKAFVDRLLGDEARRRSGAPRWRPPTRRSRPATCRARPRSIAAVLQEDAQNVAALAGLAQCYLKSGDMARAEQTIGLVPPDKRDAGRRSPACARRSSWRARPPRPATSASCKAKVAGRARPTIRPASTCHGAGGRPARRRRRSTSCSRCFRRDRNWNEEAARKQLVQLFEAWGPKDPATLDGRRRLSSLMFS